MTTSVYSMPKAQSAHLVAHLRSTTPQQAIDTLARAGVLAIEGPEVNSIVLVGFRLEIRTLLHDFALYGGPHKPHSHFLMGKLSKLKEAI